MIVPDERPTRDALGYPRPVRSFREHLTWIVPLAIVINLPVLILGLSSHGRADDREGSTKVAQRIAEERRLSCEVKLREALAFGTSCLEALDVLENYPLQWQTLVQDVDRDVRRKKQWADPNLLKSLDSFVTSQRLPTLADVRAVRGRVAPAVAHIQEALSPTGIPFTPSDDLLSLLIKESAAANAGAGSYEYAIKNLVYLQGQLP